MDYDYRLNMKIKLEIELRARSEFVDFSKSESFTEKHWEEKCKSEKLERTISSDPDSDNLSYEYREDRFVIIFKSARKNGLLTLSEIEIQRGNVHLGIISNTAKNLAFIGPFRFFDTSVCLKVNEIVGILVTQTEPYIPPEVEDLEAAPLFVNGVENKARCLMCLSRSNDFKNLSMSFFDKEALVSRPSNWRENKTNVGYMHLKCAEKKAPELLGKAIVNTEHAHKQDYINYLAVLSDEDVLTPCKHCDKVIRKAEWRIKQVGLEMQTLHLECALENAPNALHFALTNSVGFPDADEYLKKVKSLG